MMRLSPVNLIADHLLLLMLVLKEKLKYEVVAWGFWYEAGQWIATVRHSPVCPEGLTEALQRKVKVMPVFWTMRHVSILREKRTPEALLNESCYIIFEKGKFLPKPDLNSSSSKEQSVLSSSTSDVHNQHISLKENLQTKKSPKHLQMSRFCHCPKCLR